MISLGLPFYTDRRQLTKNLDYANDRNYPFISKAGYVTPFHLVVGSGAAFTHCKLNGVDVNLNLIRTAYDDYDVITNLGTTQIAQTSGSYELELSYGGVVYWSDDIMMCDVSDYITIEYKHLDPFYIKPYVFPNIQNFKHVIYIDSDFGKPSYNYGSVVKARSGTILPETNTLHKLHKFNFLATEAQIDSFAQVRLFDCVEIVHRGRKYEVEDFLMTNPDWQQNGLVAGVTAEVKTSSISVTYGRGYEQICEDDDNTGGAEECNIPEIKGPYQNFNDAIADGVAAGDYFDLTVTNDHGFFPSFVFEMDPTTSYLTPGAGEAVVGKDVCYVLGDGNGLGMFLNNGSGRTAGVVAMASLTTQTYNNDQDAALSGLDTFYWFYDINYSHVTFAKAMRVCSIELGKVLVGTCVSGKHFVSVNVNYSNVKSLKFTTQGQSVQTTVSGTGSETLTITNLPCDGAQHTIKVEDLLQTCSAMSGYTSPLSNPGITTGGWRGTNEDINVTLLDCKSVNVPVGTSVDILFVGSQPLPEIVNAQNGNYKLIQNGVTYFAQVIRNPTSMQVFIYGTGIFDFLLVDSSNDTILNAQNC